MVNLPILTCPKCGGLDVEQTATLAKERGFESRRFRCLTAGCRIAFIANRECDVHGMGFAGAAADIVREKEPHRMAVAELPLTDEQLDAVAELFASKLADRPCVRPKKAIAL
jgi:hypothetical protein